MMSFDSDLSLRTAGRAIRRLATVLFSLVALGARAQLAWSVYDETTLTPVTSVGERVTLTVAAGQRATLVTTNLVPIDLSATTATPVEISLTFSVSGG